MSEKKTLTEQAADAVNEALEQQAEESNPVEDPSEAHLMRMEMESFYKLQWMAEQVKRYTAEVTAAHAQHKEVQYENHRRLEAAKNNIRASQDELKHAQARFNATVAEVEGKLGIDMRKYSVREDGVLIPAPEEDAKEPDQEAPN